MQSDVITDNHVDENDLLEKYQELKKTNISENKLFHNEKTIIIGIRATQLSKNSPSFIQVPKGVTSVTEIAEMELDQRKLPYIIKRVFETHDEYWKLEDLV